MNFQDRFDILLEIRLSGVTERWHTMLYGKSQFNCIVECVTNQQQKGLDMSRKTVLSVAIVVIFGGFCQFVQAETSFDRVRYSINKNEWKFKRAEVEKGHEIGLKDDGWLKVTIPHDYNGGVDGVHSDVFNGRFDFENDVDKRLMYKGPGWYRALFTIDKQYEGKRVFIEFEAVSLDAMVWINGKEVGRHQGGYTAFSFDITDQVRYGKENLLAVRADNTNNPAIAPWMANEQLAFPFSFDFW